jgi:NADPH:quinone reductase-like Zn-dependent oxidoreductase
MRRERTLEPGGRAACAFIQLRVSGPLALAGRLVTCGATTGFDAKVDLRFLFSRQLSLLGSFMGTMGELHRVLQFVFRGQLKPVIDRVYPLAEIRAAHERLENKEQFGKVVVVP